MLLSPVIRRPNRRGRLGALALALISLVWGGHKNLLLQSWGLVAWGRRCLFKKAEGGGLHRGGPRSPALGFLPGPGKGFKRVPVRRNFTWKLPPALYQKQRGKGKGFSTQPPPGKGLEGGVKNPPFSETPQKKIYIGAPCAPPGFFYPLGRSRGLETKGGRVFWFFPQNLFSQKKNFQLRWEGLEEERCSAPPPPLG